MCVCGIVSICDAQNVRDRMGALSVNGKEGCRKGNDRADLPSIKYWTA